MPTPSHEGSNRLSLKPVRQFINSVFVPICVFVISLGSFSEAFILVDDFKTLVISKFSNAYEYETLSQIHVGNTRSYIENLLGAPAATKNIATDLTVNYYTHEKYLVSGYYRGDRITAYTVVALSEGFAPPLSWYDDVSLNGQALANFSNQPQSYSFDNAKTNRFFIEMTPNELSGFFQNAYLGTLQYGNSDINLSDLDALYQADVYGSEQQTLQKIEQYRAATLPNFYGQGELDIEILQQGILSNGEFLSYFNN